MISEAALWLVFLVPLGSFLLISLVIRPFFNKWSGLAAYITIAAVGLSLILSFSAISSVISSDVPIEFASHKWVEVGEFAFEIGILLDPLTAIMLVVVSGVSLLVQIYSIGYMRGDPGYARYFAYMSLFTASMLGLVLASNIVQMFVFWEGVGLGSYLLIGFWFQRPAAAAAAKKAFIVTRLGDFGFLLAIIYLFAHQDAFAAAGMNSLVIVDIYAAAGSGLIATGAVTWIAIGLFAGAAGKSAQFPLHTWLPDAMEGPTPVSALIHAATMVAAGVFLVARFFPLFEQSEVALSVVAIVGGVTAIFAASIGLVMNDIKRVLAYSTISQLGYMMLALGVGGYGAAIFHLFTHAIFKALLFLGSGSVNHATGTFDMRYMGGLRKKMPWTYVTFLIGSLSLAGIVPFAGFWSKDEVLGSAWNAGGSIGQIVFWLALATVFMTAFYMFRVIFMTFEGDFKGGADEDPASDGHGGVHLGESPRAMVLPLIVLAVPAVIAGIAINPVFDIGIVPTHWLSHFLDKGPVHVEAESINLGIAVISTAAAVVGIFLAFLMYKTRSISAEMVGSAFKPIYILLSRKYYIDELYEDVLVRKAFYGGLAKGSDWFDKSVVDRVANLIGWFNANIGGTIRQIQTGQLQGYAAVIAVGILVLFSVFLFIR